MLTPVFLSQHLVANTCFPVLCQHLSLKANLCTNVNPQPLNTPTGRDATSVAPCSASREGGMGSLLRDYLNTYHSAKSPHASAELGEISFTPSWARFHLPLYQLHGGPAPATQAQLLGILRLLLRDPPTRTPLRTTYPAGQMPPSGRHARPRSAVLHTAYGEPPHVRARVECTV